MLNQVFRFRAQKRCFPSTLSYFGVSGPCRRSPNRCSFDVTTTVTTRSTTLLARNSISQPINPLSAFPTALFGNTRHFPKAFSASHMNKALFHASNCANVSIQDLPESLVYYKSMEGFTHGFWVALLAATPYYALNRHWATKKPWLQWGCKAVPLSIGLVLAAIAMEKDPHTGRWKFILTEVHASTSEDNAQTMDSANQALSLSSVVSSNNPTQIAPEIKISVPQEDEEETESEQEATGQHVATRSKREDLVLDQNDPRLLVSERVLDRLLMAIEAEDEGRLRLKTFLWNLPTTPPQAPNKNILQGIEILVKKANKDAVMAREGRQSKRWFQGQKHPFRIYVTNNSDKFYAYAESDNSVILESGIMEGLAMDEDLIATVVAHELAHLVQRQHQERLSNAALVHLLHAASLAMFWPVASILGPYITMVVAGGVVTGSELLAQRFAVQESEHEADVLAMSILGLAGYDPMNILAYHLRLAQREEFELFGLGRTFFTDMDLKSSRTKVPISPSLFRSESSDLANTRSQQNLAAHTNIDRDALAEKDPILAHNQLIREYLETSLLNRWSLSHPSSLERKIRCARALHEVRCKWRLSESIRQSQQEEDRHQKGIGQG